MPGTGPPWRPTEPLTRRQKRVMGAGGGLVIVVVGGTLAWSATHSGSYGPSENGCVNVAAPSAMGGMILHRCGADARTWCRAAYAENDRLSLLAQPQCRLAGITPEPSAPAPATPGGG